MSEDSKETKVSDSPRRYVHMPAAAAPEVGGRRGFFVYKDFGLKEASNGFMRAQMSTTKTGLTKATGWHYHTCEVQFNYIIKGWADLQFEDGKAFRIEAGDTLFIPGGIKHNELRTSDDLEALEVTVPYEMGTVMVDPPESWLAAQGLGAEQEEEADVTD